LVPETPRFERFEDDALSIGLVEGSLIGDLERRFFDAGHFGDGLLECLTRDRFTGRPVSCPFKGE
jgi:hypothetical protein